MGNGLMYKTGVEDACSNGWSKIYKSECPFNSAVTYDRRETCNPDGASTGKYDFRWAYPQTDSGGYDYEYIQGPGDGMCCCDHEYTP